MNDELVSRIVLFVVMVGSGVLLWWMARAAASGRLKRNQFVGIRLPSTMASEEAWLAAHIRAKRPTTLAGCAAMVSGLVALLPVPMPVVVISVLVGCGAILGFTLHGARVGTRAAAEVPHRRVGQIDTWTR
ncbi:SdpI family protein [uncultured Citricoccus sp.]|uniref:SdpI family protein n=1 Tax=uncultured Citricoccus sp. TaxID=614031 RepID=UPI00261C85FB|nr:SdpI family protein [uncultured Citricoccus sp.]